MKKRRSYLIIVAIVGLTVVSCSKDHLCECTETYEGTGESWENTTDYEITDMKRKDAEESCNSGDGGQTLFGTEKYKKECELK